MKRIIAITALLILSGCVNYESKFGRNDLVWIKESILINAPIQDVWFAIGTNFENIHQFTPSVESSSYLNHTDEMTGSIRRSNMSDNDYFDVMITRWEPTSHTVEWEMVKNSMGLIKGVGIFTITEEGKSVRLTQDGGFRTSNSMMDTMAAPMYSNMFKEILAGVKHYIEDGNKITLKNKDELVKKYNTFYN